MPNINLIKRENNTTNDMIAIGKTMRIFSTKLKTFSNENLLVDETSLS
jgi:hypothetical protein